MDKRTRVIQDGAWVAANVNGTLRSDADVIHAIDVLKSADLPLHTDPGLARDPKNWDQLIALFSVIASGGRDEPVLDAGACEGSSAFLPALAECGYTSLTGCNIDQHSSMTVCGHGVPIRYQMGDVCDLPFPTHTFRFVACFSVIEHGVSWRPFIAEMRRVIKPGGFLFVSTDYWPSKIDTGGQHAFGSPVHVFDRAEIEDMILWANAREDFTLDGVPHLDVSAPVVQWLGMKYTFLNLLFRRR